jgi:hypothetical protein
MPDQHLNNHPKAVIDELRIHADDELRHAMYTHTEFRFEPTHNFTYDIDAKGNLCITVSAPPLRDMPPRFATEFSDWLRASFPGGALAMQVRFDAFIHSGIKREALHAALNGADISHEPD